MTHAATSPPDNPQTGEQMGYEMYSQNRIHILQQIVRCASVRPIQPSVAPVLVLPNNGRWSLAILFLMSTV